ncbi:hypothetical protein JL720_17081 [Aureococcus anophagefferens]|nr:hypothetical protein JL720_17081 [Aureococcus anophagefferens]
MTTDDDASVQTSRDELWVRDDTSSHCFGCEREFSFARRRHHCRRCGGLYCGGCSRNSMSLSALAMDGGPAGREERVCDDCWSSHQERLFLRSLASRATATAAATPRRGGSVVAGREDLCRVFFLDGSFVAVDAVAPVERAADVLSRWRLAGDVDKALVFGCRRSGAAAGPRRRASHYSEATRLELVQNPLAKDADVRRFALTRSTARHLPVSCYVGTGARGGRATTPASCRCASSRGPSSASRRATSCSCAAARATSSARRTRPPRACAARRRREKDRRRRADDTAAAAPAEPDCVDDAEALAVAADRAAAAAGAAAALGDSAQRAAGGAREIEALRSLAAALGRLGAATAAAAAAVDAGTVAAAARAVEAADLGAGASRQRRRLPAALRGDARGGAARGLARRAVAGLRRRRRARCREACRRALDHGDAAGARRRALRRRRGCCSADASLADAPGPAVLDPLVDWAALLGDALRRGALDDDVADAGGGGAPATSERRPALAARGAIEAGGGVDQVERAADAAVNDTPPAARARRGRARRWGVASPGDAAAALAAAADVALKALSLSAPGGRPAACAGLAAPAPDPRVAQRRRRRAGSGGRGAPGLRRAGLRAPRRQRRARRAPAGGDAIAGVACGDEFDPTTGLDPDRAAAAAALRRDAAALGAAAPGLDAADRRDAAMHRAAVDLLGHAACARTTTRPAAHAASPRAAAEAAPSPPRSPPPEPRDDDRRAAAASPPPFVVVAGNRAIHKGT